MPYLPNEWLIVDASILSDIGKYAIVAWIR